MKPNKKIKIGNRLIGDGEPCFIIAEVGSNHNRDLSQAKRLIDAAKEAGVNAVKFQTYSAETLYSKEMSPLKLLKETKKPFDIVKEIEIPREWHKILAEYAKNQGLIFLSTPFDEEAIDQLNPLVPAFKWASPELIDRPLLEYVARKGKPLIISTGFYGLKEISDAVKWVRSKGNNQIILLHCVGLYPPLYEELNLKVIETLKKRFNVPVGLSDHSVDVVIPAVAVALGANIIEKHFTLSRKMKGPDHSYALEPGELKEMVKNIRNIEKSLGSGVKKPVKREIEKERLIRRGVATKRSLKKGEKITDKNIITKRVGAGAILPKDFYKILNKTLKKNIKADQKLTWRII